MPKKVHPDNPAFRNPEFARRAFESASQAAAWLYVGRNLRSSADAIFDRERPVATKYWNELQRIHSAAAKADAPLENFDFAKFPAPNLDGFHLLIAYAIENFLKGLIVAKQTAKFAALLKRLKLPDDLNTHDLSELDKLATPTATIAPHLLDSLTYMAEWRARYPMPVSVDRFWPMHPDGTPKTAGFSWPGSYSEILEFCDRIEAELQALI